MADLRIQAFKICKTSEELIFLLFVSKFGFKVATEEANIFHWNISPQLYELCGRINDKSNLQRRRDVNNMTYQEECFTIGDLIQITKKHRQNALTAVETLWQNLQLLNSFSSQLAQEINIERPDLSNFKLTRNRWELIIKSGLIETLNEFHIHCVKYNELRENCKKLGFDIIV